MQHLAGYASGGVVGREWSAASMSSQVNVSPTVSLDPNQFRSMVREEVAGMSLNVKLGNREINAIVSQAAASVGGR